MREVVRIGACQTPEILGDVEAAVGCIKGFCGQAEPQGVDLLLFPECFLQGYLVTEAAAAARDELVRCGRLKMSGWRRRRSDGLPS